MARERLIEMRIGKILSERGIARQGLVVAAPAGIQIAPANPDVHVKAAHAPLNAIAALAQMPECVLTEECIDQYLWSVYERAPKVDTIKVEERIKVSRRTARAGLSRKLLPSKVYAGAMATDLQPMW
jgi:hypothetical protein